MIVKPAFKNIEEVKSCEVCGNPIKKPIGISNVMWNKKRTCREECKIIRRYILKAQENGVLHRFLSKIGITTS